MKLRGALIGCGMISEFHLRGWNRMPEVEIVTLCDRTPVPAEERRARYAPTARVYSDLALMLTKERLDFLDILTTPEWHAGHCRAAQAAGVHIICQKLLTSSLDEARRLVADFRGYPRLFAVHENHRFRLWFQDVRSMLRSGTFGKAHLLKIEHLNAVEPGEAYKNDAASGVWLKYGSHLVDMMRSLLGDPLRVHAGMHRLNTSIKAESLALATYEYTEQTAIVSVAWKHAAMTQS